MLSFGVLDQCAPVGFLCAPRHEAGAAFVDASDPPERIPFLATRAREEERTTYEVSAVLDTDHPDALRAEVRCRLAEDGTVSVVVHVEGASVILQKFAAKEGERFLGFGERSHDVSLYEGVVENYVGEGPFQPHEYQFLTDTVPPWGIRNRPDATYFPIPWVLSTHGYGLSIDQDDLSYIRVRVDSANSWSIEAEADSLCYTVYPGPSPLDALRRYTAAVGRQPAPERWFFGPWYQSGHENHVPQEEERRQLDALRDAPASAVETHCRYLPLGEDRCHEDEERARTSFFHSRGLAALSYINPLVGEDYPEAFEPASASGALQRDESGLPYLFRAYAGGRVPPHSNETQYDFSSPVARDCWGEVAHRIVAAGFDGWMEDFGEYTPLDVVVSENVSGVAAHNRYPTQYHSAAASVADDLEKRYSRRLARFVRSGWTGTAAVAPIVWGGDPTTSWGFDGLASAVIEGLSMGASGVALWGSDTGGFMSTLERLTPELLRRWIQFSAFCPVMRTKAGGIEIPPYDRPQIWDPEVQPCWQRWAQWHTRLNDYLMAAHETYRQSGRPIMCSLELVYPDLGPLSDQYLLGEHLLVAPVLEPGSTSRRVVLPPGTWVDVFEPTRSFEGPGAIDAQAGPDDIPVFARAGAAIALLPEDVRSLSPYAPTLEDRRVVHAFLAEGPGGWSGPLGPGLSCRNEVTEDSWTLELFAPRPFTWELRTWPRRAPSEVEIEGSWSFDGTTLSCSTRGEHPMVRVRWR